GCIEIPPGRDRVLVSTTTGRIRAADGETGQTAWQTRLSDRPVDRLGANEEFTVVKVTDDTNVRIGAFDTNHGQRRPSRSGVVQSGPCAVNLALAADGTLVYTTQNQLSKKDLYKP